MKIPLFGIGLFSDRRLRLAWQLGALVIGLATAHRASAQLAVTTLATGFSNPYGVAADASGNAYVADTSNHVIKRIALNGAVSTIAGLNGVAGLTDDSVSGGSAARFAAPRGIAINAAGTTLYVADSGNNAIRVIALSSVGGSVTSVTTLAGTTGAPGFTNSGAASTFNGPRGIAINPAGDTLYIADTFNYAIRRIVISGTAVSTVAGTGSPGFANGDSSTATFNQPWGIAVNAAGTAVFLADFANHAIRRVVLSPVAVSTYAGTGGAGAANNTTGTLAQFSNPAGLAADAADNLYVGDFGNNAVRLIAAAGSNDVSTPAGGTNGNLDGTGSSARFLGLTGVAVRAVSGVTFVFVADTNNQSVRKASTPQPASVSSPANQTAAVGANGVTFTVVVTGGWPAPSLQWQRQPNGVGAYENLINGGTYSGVNTTTLTVNGISQGMNGDLFRLIASNSSGSPAGATPAILTVSQPAVAPTFPSSSVTFTATVGQSASFANPASGSTPITYTVTAGSSGIFSVNSSTGTITSLANPTSTADSATFTVTASNGTAPNATRTVTINVGLTGNAPVINVQPQSQSLGVGVTTASLSVIASGTPAITSYSWERQINGVGSFFTVTDGGSGPFFSGSATANLNISSISSANNNDTYRVVIGNGTTPTTSNGAVITVGGSGVGVPTITQSPSNAAGDPGFTAVFTAVAVGNPSPTLRWQRQAANSGGFFDLFDGFPYSGTTSNTLVVSGVNSNMTGDQFRLTATNIYGTATSTAASLATTSQVPVFSLNPQNITVAFGQAATFTATTIGNPTPTIRWQRQAAGSFTGFYDLNDDGTYYGTFTNTLTIPNPNSTMNGDQFRAIASNAYSSGVPSSVAVLNVNTTPPTITLNPTSLTANVGQSIVFTGNATGVPTPTLRWQRQPSGTSGFVNLIDDGTFTGTATPTLTITSVSAGMTGDLFRLEATGGGGAVQTNSAFLTVNLGTTIATLAGLAQFPGSLDGTGPSALFNAPGAIVADNLGNYYIADTGNSIIRKMNSVGLVTTIAGLAGARGNSDGIGSAARFNSPGGVAVDSVGNVYVADTFNHTIRVISPGGNVTTLAGSAGSSGALDGVGTFARFSGPSGLAVDGSGAVYVADTGNHAIRRVFNGNVTTYAGALGFQGFVDSGNPLSARFNSPNTVVVDNGGNLYVADSQNNAIRKITAFGGVSTLAGNTNGFSGSSDGNGPLALFNRPNGLSVDFAGNVYVADSFNNTIRKITPAGEVTTLAGLAGVPGTTDGVGGAARFSRPFGVVLDTSGNLYVADTGNHTIRRSGTATAPVITLQPVNRLAGIGQSVTFTVTATGTPTPTNFQWQRQPAFGFSFTNLSTDATYSGVNTATLTVQNITSAMAGDQFRVVIANGAVPPATSNPATLTLGVAPVFTSAPSATFQAGQANSFTFTTDSTAPTTFTSSALPSWATLSTTGVLSGNPPDQTGSPFTLTISGNNGAVVTQTFTLNVLPVNIAPTITTQPAAVAINQGESATFSVVAGGTPPFTYQWRRNGITIAGATGSTLTLPAVRGSNAGSYSVLVTNTAGSVASAGGTLVVNTVPNFTSQPTAQVALVGGSATFIVSVSGGTNFVYQWRRNGVPIAGANAASFTVNNITAAEAGNYDVVVLNALGTVNSSLAQLSVVTTATAPTITAQPAAKTALAGTSVTLSASASGAPTPSYQWRKNGAVINGAVSPTLTFSSVQSGDAANYDVVVSNSVGSVTTSVAGLRVLARSSAGVYFGTFSNGLGNFALYVRDDNSGVFLGYLPGSTAPVMNLNIIVNEAGQFSFNQGNIVGGAATPGEPARAAALAPVVVTGAIGGDGAVSGSISGGASATLSATRVPDTGPTQNVAGFYTAGANANAASAYTIASANSQAFVVAQSGTTTDGGIGSATNAGQINVVTNRSFINESINAPAGLVTGSSSGAVAATFVGASDSVLALQRLVNISSRARVGAGDAVAIAGFVIAGEQSKPVLIRAVGPTLGAAPFNVTGALAAPRLEVFRGSTSVTSNAGIGTNRAAVDAAAQQVAAFTLGASGADAALVTTLAPGNYTAVVSSTTTAAGVALIEVYDLSAPTVGQKLLNISTRASAGTAENTLIAGFVVQPGAAKRVLIRGVGPGLAAFGITGVLAQPTLTLFSGSTSVATNTNWSSSADAASISLASVQAGAFGLSNNDSALLVTLLPGNYTAAVTGPGTATGVALIEVYEVP